jgi:hypothetical protein
VEAELVVSAEQQRITTKIGEARQYHEQLKEKLSRAARDLNKITEQTSVYARLLEVSEQLQQLQDSGGGKLFWDGKYSNEAEFVEHVNNLRTKAKQFTDQVDAAQDKKLNLEKQVEQAGYEVGFLIEDLKNAKINEAESKNDFIIEREYENQPFHSMVMPWDKKDENEKRFRKYLLVALLYSILFVLVIPYIEIPLPDKDEEVKVPERIVKFLKKKEPKPKPKKAPQLAGKKKPTAEEKTKARKKAAKTGLLAFKNNFADLMDNMSEAKLGANAKLSKQGKRSKSTARSLVLSQAQSGSGGINASNLSRDAGIAGDAIGSVGFSRVNSAIGTGAEDDRPLSSGPGPSRTDEEIQIVFDRYKAALYRIYNRELRKNPTLQGKMVLRITILPSGKVSKASIESTDLDSALLSKKMIERVKRFNFGAKKDVPTITILYPIDFLPAS